MRHYGGSQAADAERRKRAIRGETGGDGSQGASRLLRGVLAELEGIEGRIVVYCGVHRSDRRSRRDSRAGDRLARGQVAHIGNVRDDGAADGRIALEGAVDRGESSQVDA